MLRLVIVVVAAWLIGAAAAKAGGFKRAARGLRWLVRAWWGIVVLLAALIPMSPHLSHQFRAGFLEALSGPLARQLAAGNTSGALGMLAGGLAWPVGAYYLSKWRTGRRTRQAHEALAGKEP